MWSSFQENQIHERWMQHVEGYGPIECYDDLYKDHQIDEEIGRVKFEYLPLDYDQEIVIPTNAQR